MTRQKARGKETSFDHGCFMKMSSDKAITEDAVDEFLTKKLIESFPFLLDKDSGSKKSDPGEQTRDVRSTSNVHPSSTVQQANTRPNNRRHTYTQPNNAIPSNAHPHNGLQSGKSRGHNKKAKKRAPLQKTKSAVTISNGQQNTASPVPTLPGLKITEKGWKTAYPGRHVPTAPINYNAPDIKKRSVATNTSANYHQKFAQQPAVKAPIAKTEKVQGTPTVLGIGRGKVSYQLNHFVPRSDYLSIKNCMDGNFKQSVICKQPQTSPQSSAARSETRANLKFRYPLFDAGAFLSNMKFHHDLRDVISRAQAVGVQGIIVPSLEISSSRRVHQLCSDFSGYIYGTAGIHPNKADTWSESVYAELEELVSQPQIVAVGTIGLDFRQSVCSQEKQLEVFEKQVQLACKYKKPLVVQERDAIMALIKVIQKYYADLPAVVLHSYLGSKQDALTYLALGFYLSINGNILREFQTENLVSLLKDNEIPLEKLMLQSNGPFGFPQEVEQLVNRLTDETRSILDIVPTQRSEPCFMPILTEVIADIMGKSPSEVADIATQNTLKFFNLMGEAKLE